MTSIGNDIIHPSLKRRAQHKRHRGCAQGRPRVKPWLIYLLQHLQEPEAQEQLHA